jgi:predicted nucleic acid-binding protein
MGLVLDSSVLIFAEREAKPVSRLLAELQQGHGENEIVLSSITVVELEHGLHRAQAAEQARKRRDYLDEIFAAIPVESFSKEMAQIAARVDADARKTGEGDSIRGFADRCYRDPLQLCRRHAEYSPLSNDSESDGALSLSFTEPAE